MISKELQEVFDNTLTYVIKNDYEYISIEHVCLYLFKTEKLKEFFNNSLDIDEFLKSLKVYIDMNTPKFPQNIQNKEPSETIVLTTTIQNMLDNIVNNSSKEEANIFDMLLAILKNDDAYCTYLLKKYKIYRNDIEYVLQSIEDNNNTKNIDFTDEQISSFSTELVSYVKKHKIDPIVARDKEIKRVIEILARKKKSNPILIGETGVGKTAIVEALALKIASKQVPKFLKNYKIYSINMGSLVAGTAYKGDLEQKVKNLIELLLKDKKSILFIDEIHTIIGTGASYDSSLDMANMLKPYVSSGEIKLMGATTYEEYRKSFSKEKAFARRFSKVEINEPSTSEAIDILNKLKKYYEKFHNIKYSKKSIELSVELAQKYINDKFLPDSAIDILDETGAVAKLNHKKVVTKTDIEQTVAKIAQVPAKTATASDLDLLKTLQEDLQSKIFGQDEAIETIVKTIKINKAGMQDDNKPVGSFLFTGSTGVGKTEVVKELASLMGIHFERFDMSEYSEAHTVSRLIGSPVGYVGHEKGGLLTEAIKNHPYTILLLDEIEKAHQDLTSILLQIMDNATLTDGSGMKVDFRHVILVMTSNLGATQSNVMGFNKDETLNENKAVKKFFSPEFRNRLDAIVNFKPLTKDIIVNIVNKFIKDIETQLKDKNITLTLTKKATEELATKGYDKLMGARPLKRVISENIKLPLSEEILFGKLVDGGDVTIDFDGKFVFDIN